MRIENKTKKTTVSENALLCPLLWQKARGLMFRSQRDLVFVEKKERRICLHMWFVFYPIDVVYCNAEKRVVEVKENFRPWTFYLPREKALFVLELKAGTIDKTKITINDLLVLGQ